MEMNSKKSKYWISEMIFGKVTKILVLNFDETSSLTPLFDPDSVSSYSAKKVSSLTF
jgi:hypothetical protein